MTSEEIPMPASSQTSQESCYPGVMPVVAIGTVTVAAIVIPAVLALKQLFFLLPDTSSRGIATLKM